MLEFVEGFGPWAPVIVFFAAYSETAAFLGLVVPGETLMIAGGAAAAIGGTPLWIVVTVAIIGAILGDATGYFVGRRYGTALLERDRLARFRQPVEKAGDFLERHGWWALILARFLSMFRAVVPFAAGAARMPYGQFAVGNVAGSTLYGGAIAGFGYWAGSRWEQIEGIVRTGGLTLGLFAAIIAAIVFGTRWIVRHRTRVERLLAAWRRLPLVGAVLGLGVTRTGRARPFLALVPPIGLGLALLTGFGTAGLVDWSFIEASVIRRIQGAEEVVVEIAAAIVEAAVHPLVLVALIVAAGTQAALIGWRPMALVGTSFMATLLLATAFNDQIDRPFGPVDLELALDPNFPDAVMTVGAASIVALAWPWRASWAAGAVRIGTAAVLVVTLATARAVTVSAYPVDIIAGMCLGVVVVIAAGLVVDPRLRNKLKTEPETRGIGAETPAVAAPAHERPTF